MRLGTLAAQMYPANHNSGDPPAGDVAPWEESQGASSQLMSQEGVFQLTQDLRKFSETLTSLKSVFFEEKDIIEQSLRVVAHERLGELLKVLKNIVNKYTELNSTGILNAAEMLINHIKNFNYESDEEVVPPEIFSAINNLALAFSSSVSECLIGDINISPRQSMVSSQSFENLPLQPPQRQASLPFDPDVAPVPAQISADPVGPLATSETVADVLDHVTENLDICFERAKAWSKYAGDLITYVKKRAHIEMEYAKQLTKLSQTTRAVLSEQSYLPFQSLYCTAVDNDKEYASNLVTTYQNLILAHKFIEPLQARRLDHDRQHKALRDAWRKDKRRLEEAEVNLKKAKHQYQVRNQEYQKAKDAAIRADQQQHIAATAGDPQHSRQGSNPSVNPLTLSSGGSSNALTMVPSSKMEKKKKQEDDSHLKATQAEHYYRACVNEANFRRKELERKEEQYLKTLRDLMTQCDQTTKSCTLSFFQHHYELTSPLRVQFQALLDESKNYEPGFQYAEYLKHVTPQNAPGRLDYQFEPYAQEGAVYMEHNAVAQRAEMAPPDDSSPISGGASQTKYSATRRASHRGAGFSDTESSSSRSLDDISPSASPGNPPNRKDMYRRRPSTEGSLSSEELLDDGQKENAESTRLAPPPTFEQNTNWSPESSPAPTRPQLPKMKKVVANVRDVFKMMRNPKPTVFGVDFAVASQESPDGVPFIIKKCIAEVDNRALTVKGIYRVNGVKNRIEKLCSLLDTPQCVRADLSEQSPHDVSGVLKYFLRQLPEPLLLYRFYNEFLEVAKDYTEIIKETKVQDAAPVEDLDEERVQSLPETEQEERTERLYATLDRMRRIVEKLPESNRNTLQYIIAHLSRVAEHEGSNKMTASNLAIIFGPTLLGPIQEAGKELQPLFDLPSQSRAIEMLITHRNEIFDTYQSRAGKDNAFKTQNSTDEPLQTDDQDTGGAPTATKVSPQSSQSQPSTLSSASSGEVPASTNQVHLTINDSSQSTINTSSSGETSISAMPDDPGLRPGQKDSFSGESSTDQSNGGMNVIDDGRTLISHSVGIKRSSSSRDVAGVLLDAKSEDHFSHDDITLMPSTTASSLLRLPQHGTRPTSLSPSRGAKILDRATFTGSGERKSPAERCASPASPISPLRSRGRQLAEDFVVTETATDTPVAPARLKSKSKRPDKKDPTMDNTLLEQDPQSPSTKLASPHRPRSRRITNYSEQMPQDPNHVPHRGDGDLGKATRRVSLPASPKYDVDAKPKRHTTLATLIHPTAYKPRDDPKSKAVSGTASSGRRLPQLPTSKTKDASPARSRPISMPGRTPPFNKTQTWSFAKSDIAESNNEGRGVSIKEDLQKRILIEENDEEVSFC